MIKLTKNSVSSDIKLYFEEIVSLQTSGEEFPVSLDDVWPLAYSRKDKAVRALEDSELFIQDTDYQVFPQNGENPQGGRPTEIIMISIPCLEYFIARKKREVFEVYRQVFHRAMASVPEAKEEDAVMEAVRRIMDMQVDSRVKQELINRVTGKTGQAAIAPAEDPNEMCSATKLLKKYRAGISVEYFNDVLCAIGYMDRVETKRGYYCVLTGEGLEYGENRPNPYWRGRRTMPVYRAGSFGKLIEIVNDCFDDLKKIYGNED